MSAYSTGPFDSDTAQDLLDHLAGLEPAERLARLRLVFRSASGGQDVPSEGIDPTEVLAGAALVALTLSDGQRVREIPQMDFDEEIAAAAIPAPDAELVRLALHALHEATADGQWYAAWITDDDRRASREAVDVVATVLADHLAVAS
jgi:alpha-glucosidase